MQTSINSAIPFSELVLLLAIFPSLSDTDVVAESIPNLVFASITLAVSKTSQIGTNLFIEYISSLPLPPLLFDEINPSPLVSLIEKAKSSALLFTGIPTFLADAHFPSTSFVKKTSNPPKPNCESDEKYKVFSFAINGNISCPSVLTF